MYFQLFWSIYNVLKEIEVLLRKPKQFNTFNENTLKYIENILKYLCHLSIEKSDVYQFFVCSL